MMSAKQVERPVRQVSQLQDEMACIWAALEASSSADEPFLLPTPEGGTRLFQPHRFVSPEVRDAIRRATLLAVSQRERSPEQIVQDGQAALEHARQQAAPSGTAIDDEMEAARGD